jgi:hypothetical protein
MNIIYASKWVQGKRMQKMTISMYEFLENASVWKGENLPKCRKNCFFHNLVRTSKLLQKGCINGMKINEKSVWANPLGWLWEASLSFWVLPEFLVFSVGLRWKKYLQKHDPGAPKGSNHPPTPAGTVPPLLQTSS